MPFVAVKSAKGSKPDQDAEVIRRQQEIAREQEIIRELCLSNGLSYHRIQQEGHGLRMLEMFFSGYPRMVGLNYFPNLQNLCINGQVITRIENLQYCPHLREVWIFECNLKKIEGLEALSMLRKLYLYDNEISKMENLEQLTELQVLWLSGNRITNIEGLSTLRYLSELNLANNNISKIGNALNPLHFLEKLELSGNNINSFKDLTNLSRLMSLRDLGLKSPEYQPNPVGLLCNYSTHILYHLPQLHNLDTQDISSKMLRDLAETTVQKKKMFYNMKVKTLQRDLAEIRRHLVRMKEKMLDGPYSRIKTLMYMCKEIERDIKELKAAEGESQSDYQDTETAHESGTESEKDAKEAKAAEERSTINLLKIKQKAIKERVKKWEKKVAEMEFYYEEAMDKMKQVTDLSYHRLTMELETGGNVRFEDGKPTDVWFSSCHDLLLSRFCAADYKDHGVIGIKIHRITRIHNRNLRTQFDECLASLMEEEEKKESSISNSSSSTPGGTTNVTLPNNKTVNYRKLLEYLFWIWDPELPGGATEPSRVLEEGFMDPATYKKLGKDGAVPLTNSVSIADKQRMCHLTKLAKGKEYADPCPFRHGQIVVAKVYLGKSQQYGQTKLVDKMSFPKADTVYRPKKEADKTGGSSEERAGGKCECSSRQCEWFAFNHELVMPEYVIDFEYITRNAAKNPLGTVTDDLLERKDKKTVVSIDELPSDEDILYMEPETKPRPRLIQLSEDLLMKACKTTSLSTIQVLNLHGNGLCKLRHLQAMPALTRLTISFNELTRLDDVANLPALEFLDASFNKLISLEGVRGLGKLVHLDVSWNQLYNTRDDISILRKHTPALQILDVRHNKWQKPEGLRLRAIGRMKSLTKLNGSPVTENEATAALRMAAGSRISQVSLLAHSRTDLMRPRTLSLQSYAQVLIQTSRNKPDRTSESDSLWYSQVTTLNLDGQHISKVSNLERLENLRWASFSDNDITRIEGLDNCVNLEELSFENNCLTRVEGLGKLAKLRRLNLSHNYLTSLDNSGLDRLTQLHSLALLNNRIHTLAGVHRATGLVELYVGNNCVGNVREIFYLKNLTNLLILDLFGNPVVNSTDNYRLFVIYHLKSLKALDGLPIESSEGTHARDAFGGRLTLDFVAERLGHANFNDIKELDFPQCSIRTIDLGMGDQFLNLRSINLEHNNLTSFSGLIYLMNLRVLCLNHNHIECIVHRPKQTGSQGRGSRVPASQVTTANITDPFNPDSYTPLLENLEVLHLGYNGIKDLAALQLGRLSSLKALFLQGNEVTKIEGLEGLHDLRELVLDRNKIKGVSEYSFANQWNLQELHLEENRIRDLSGLNCLENLQRLFLGQNRVQDISELDKLEIMPNLIELSVVNNAVARRLLHRPMLVFRMPSLVVIDGIPVSDEERTKAELYFMEQQPPPQLSTTVEATLPGIGQYKTQIPVKVTNMQLLSGPFGPYADKTFGGTLHVSDDIIQQEMQRVGAGRKRGSNRNDAPQQGVGQVGNQAKMSGTMSYQHATYGQGQGHGLGSRSQQQLSQVPYVPYQHSNEHLSHTESLTRMNKNNRR